VDEPAGTCTGCGRPLREGAEFCGYCGTKAPDQRLAAVPDPIPRAEPDPEPPVEPEPVAATPSEAEPAPAPMEAAPPTEDDPVPPFDAEVEQDDDELPDGDSYAELYAAADAPEPRRQSAGTGRFRISLTLALTGLMLVCVAAYLVYR
jgi:hypothetical protein